MKRLLSVFAVLMLLAPNMSAAAPSLAERLKGQVLLQVQAHGEAYYVNPTDAKAYYLKDGAAAYAIMRQLGLGISESDYAKLASGNAALRSAVRGKIVLRVHAHGEAYYLCPRTGSLSYLKDGAAAYGVMRECGLGVSDADLSLITKSTDAYEPAATNSQQASLAGCPMFPADNPWNQDVSSLPVRSNSATYINSIGTTKGLHPDFGETREYGIPYNIADNSTKKYSVSFSYAEESDVGPYPISAAPEIEAASDQHLLVLQKDECKLYELFAAELNGNNGAGWHAGSGAIFDLRSNALRPAGWTSADAAGLPILPGLVRYDEVNAGAINHAIRFTAPKTQRAYIAPATHFASSSSDASLPPMGLRVRLKASYDISKLPTQAKVIATAMKKYGMILADNGSSWYFQGAWSPGWRDDDLNTLKNIPGSAFEAVDTGPLIK
jgi:hypothetical protein